MIAAPLDLGELDSGRIWFFFPFGSLAAPTGDVRIGPVRLTRLDWIGWRFIERTELVDEHMPPHVEVTTAVGLFDGGKVADGQDGWVSYQTEASIARDATALALRLAADCPAFVDPTLVGLYSMQDCLSKRSPGPYRQALLSGFFESGVAAPRQQTLSEADALYGQLYHLLTRAGRSASLPFELFRRSFEPYLTSQHSLLFLFAALESLFLPWTTRVDGTTLEQRVAAACRLGSVAPSIGLSGDRLRRLRNVVAHGKPDGTRLAGHLVLLQALVRGGLRARLRFSFAHPAADSTAQFNDWLATEWQAGGS